MAQCCRLFDKYLNTSIKMNDFGAALGTDFRFLCFFVVFFLKDCKTFTSMQDKQVLAA